MSPVGFLIKALNYLLQALIDRAFKIKEDVIDSLNFTQGTWNEEKQARGLLQEHIRTITACVNKLNGDIAVSFNHSNYCSLFFWV